MGDAIGWQQLGEFAGIDLGQSWVLSWHFERGALSIDMDLCLTPEHAFYEKPRPAEKQCIRPAVVEFPHCVALGVDGGKPGQPADRVEGLGNGRLEDLRREDDGPYEISGAFGTVCIHAERPVVRLQRR